MADYNKYLDELFTTTKNIGKEIGPVAKQGVSKAKTAGKWVGRTFVPYVDAGIYANTGINDIRSGHPWRGAGQLGLAAIDAGIDTAGILAGIATAPEAGAGYWGTVALKQGAKQALKKGIKTFGKPLIKKVLKDSTVPRTIGQGIASVGLQYGIDDDVLKKEQPQPQSQANTQPNNQQKLQGNSTSGNVGGGYAQYPSTSTDDFIRQLVATNGINAGDSSVPIDTTGSLENISTQQNEQPQTNNDILDKLSEYYEQQKEYRKPYLEGLQSYVDNYNDLNRRGFNMDRYLAGIAGWSGNNNFARMIGRYNPATVEATRLDLLNKLAQEQVNELDLGNKAIGNASLLQEAGLSPDAAFADPNMIKSIATIMNARTAADAKRYVADQTYKARVYDTQLDNAIALAKQQKRLDVMRELEYMKAKNRYNIAVLQAQAYGYGNANNTLQNGPL
jgi:hypothetical protein